MLFVITMSTKPCLDSKLSVVSLFLRYICAIRSVLANNLHSVLDGTHLFNGVEQKIGVAQGDKLSPLLFSLFIADMKYFLQDIDCDVIFYADDRTLGTTSPDALQNAAFVDISFRSFALQKANSSFRWFAQEFVIAFQKRVPYWWSGWFVCD